MKKTVLMALMLCFSLIASGMELSVPGRTLEGTNIGVTAYLNPTDSFTEARVFVDGKSVLMVKASGEVFSYNKKVIEPFLVDLEPTNNSGLTLYFSYFGFLEGQHSIKVKSFNEGNLVEEIEEIVEVLAGEQDNEKLEEIYDELGTDILDLQIKLRKLKEELESFKGFTQTGLSEEEQRINSYLAQIDELKNTIDSLKGSLDEAAFKKEEVVDETTVELKEEVKEDKPVVAGLSNTAFAVLGRGPTFFLSFLYAAIMIFFGVYWVDKKRGLFGRNIVFEEPVQEALDEEEPSLKSWDYAEVMESEDEKPKKKKISFRDLLRK